METQVRVAERQVNQVGVALKTSSVHRVKEHCLQAGLSWQDSLAQQTCPEQEYYEDLLRFYRHNHRVSTLYPVSAVKSYSFIYDEAPAAVSLSLGGLRLPHTARCALQILQRPSFHGYAGGDKFPLLHLYFADSHTPFSLQEKSYDRIPNFTVRLSIFSGRTCFLC